MHNLTRHKSNAHCHLYYSYTMQFHVVENELISNDRSTVSKICNTVEMELEIAYMCLVSNSWI